MSRPAALPKPPPILAELVAFAETVREVPYGDLVRTYREAGFVWRLREVEVLVGPDASALVRCDFLVGRSWDALSVLDTVTIRLPQGVGPLSVAARVQLEPTLIYLVCGRLPPAAPPAPAETRTVDVSRGDVTLPDIGQNEAADRGAPAVEPWHANGAPEAAAEPERLKVIDHLEPDGVPIFGDLYAVAGPSREVVNAVLNEIEAWLGKAASLEEIDALALKNPEMKAFIKDLGEDSDAQELLGMIKTRRHEIEVQAATGQKPRRRSAASMAN